MRKRWSWLWPSYSNIKQHLTPLGPQSRSSAHPLFLLLQVYIINVTWSDSTSQTIYRRYSKFFDLQVS
ncbi:hypothetical protein ACRRTK_011939 [Alexandromys fortis]